MKVFKTINDKSLIVKKLNPFRKRDTGIIQYTQKKYEYEAGLMVKAEVVGSRNPLYPIGSYVFIIQQGSWDGHKAGFGTIDAGMSKGEEFQIEDNPTIYKNDTSESKENLFIKINESDPFAVAHPHETHWDFIPVNQCYLARVVNPAAGSDRLDKAGVGKSKIIIPDSKDVKTALQKKGWTSEGTILGKADDCEDIGIKAHSKVVMLIQGAENNASDPAFDSKEWRIDGIPFIPTGFFDNRDQDVRSLTHLHLMSSSKDFLAEVI